MNQTPPAVVKATRVIAGITAALVIVQGAQIGTFLQGDAAGLTAHRMTGTMIVSLLALVVAGLAFVVRRRLRFVLPLALVGLGAVVAQIGTGFTDLVTVHIPLGIAIFGMYAAAALAPARTAEAV
jgi:hypothetical protein